MFSVVITTEKYLNNLEKDYRVVIHKMGRNPSPFRCNRIKLVHLYVECKIYTFIFTYDTY